MNTQEKALTGYPSIDKPWLKYYDVEKFDYNFPQMSIYDYLRKMTEGHEDYTAITYYGKKIQYFELFEHIENATKVLVGIGVKQCDRVLFLMPNIPETAYLFYACGKIGAVADYIDPRPDSIDSKISGQKILDIIKEERINAIIALDLCYLSMLCHIEGELNDLGIGQIVLVSASDSMDKKENLNYILENVSFYGIRETLNKIKRNREQLKKINELRNNSALRIHTYTELLEKYYEIEIPEIVYEFGSLVAIVHTSGTSSTKTKPIPLTHDNLNAYVHQQLVSNFPVIPGDRTLHMLPYFAAYGLVNVVHGMLCIKGNLIQIPEFVPSNLGKLIVKYKPQQIMGTPSWFLTMIKDKSLKNADLSYLTCLCYGGDSMESSDEQMVNEFLKNHNCKTVLIKGHGMSETCGCASISMNEFNQYNSIGIPLPMTIYALVDPETKELLKFEPDDKYLEGELIISSKSVTSGVLDGKIIVPHIQYDGEDYIFTRDIVRMDRNGIMTFLSRSDRSFTRYDGYKVKPYEIERIIKELKIVKYCVISPYYCEEMYGNLIIANIVLEENVPDDKLQNAREIVRGGFINNPNVSSRQIPAKIRFCEKLPMTANGKVNYRAVAEKSLDGNEITIDIKETNLSVESIEIH